MIQSFEQLRATLRSVGAPRRMAAVCAHDHATRQTLLQAEREGIAQIKYFDSENPSEAAAQAVAAIRHGEADVLMKGLIGTDELLRAVLSKESGLLPAGRVMTHMAAAEIPGRQKLLFFTDAAVIPYPTHEQRVEQVKYAATLCRQLGIEQPRIALIHCAEHGGKQFPFVDGYADIKRQAADGAFGSCIVDGPMDLKCACSAEALKAKGMTSTLQGEADVLVMPDIEAGNSLYKSLTLFAHARTAGILCGTSAPVIVPSRGDDPDSKFNSLLFALASL